MTRGRSLLPPGQHDSFCCSSRAGAPGPRLAGLALPSVRLRSLLGPTFKIFSLWATIPLVDKHMAPWCRVKGRGGWRRRKRRRWRRRVGGGAAGLAEAVGAGSAACHPPSTPTGGGAICSWLWRQPRPWVCLAAGKGPLGREPTRGGPRQNWMLGGLSCPVLETAPAGHRLTRASMSRQYPPLSRAIRYGRPHMLQPSPLQLYPPPEVRRQSRSSWRA